MPAPQPVVPYGMQRGVHVPKEGAILVVDIDGERINCTVREPQENRDLVIVEINAVPVGKGAHGHKKGDLLLVKRGVGFAGQEIWQEVTDREIRQRRMIEDQLKEEERLKQEAEAERVAAIRARDLGEIPRGKKTLGPRRSKIAKGE